MTQAEIRFLEELQTNAFPALQTVMYDGWSVRFGGGFTYRVAGHISNPNKSYGYGTCKTAEELNHRLTEVYREHVIPAVRKGLCASVYTQISDVEDEINGILTYDRRAVKPDPAVMSEIARELNSAIQP